MRKALFTVPRKNRVRVAYELDGVVQWMEDVTPGACKQVRKVAGMLGVEYRDLLAVITGEMPSEMELADNSKPALSLRVRNIHSKEATTVPDFETALATAGEAIEWDDPEQLCCLDIDYHHRAPPDPSWLLATVERIQPSPWLFWVSKGGGLHLIYKAVDFIPADELAAVGALAFLHYDRFATVELLKHTRKPPGDLFYGHENREIGFLRTVLGSEVAGDKVDEYLESRGLELERRYAHEHCPVVPGPSHGEPVFVGSHGISCHKCAAAGTCYGSRKPGFFPYTALCGGGPAGLLRRMAHRFCHWEHARIVLEHRAGLKGEIARLAWKGILHVVHGDDLRVARAMTSGRDFIRQDRRWTTCEGYYTYTKDVQPLVASLPACQDADGVPIAESVCRFLQPLDLTKEGYPTIATICGTRIFSHHLTLPDDRIAVVTPSALLKQPEMESRRPRYDTSMDIEDAWKIYEDIFPGLNRNYLMLLIAAKGVAEAQLGMPANIIVDGYSSAGKSQTVAIAAATCGDQYNRVVWVKDSQRFQQAYHTAAETGTYIAVDEIMKDADRAGSTAIEAMDIFLNLTPESLAHKLYVGAMPLGKSPVTVVTDIEVPAVVREDLQISRRFIYVHLDRKVDWMPTILASIQKIERLRLSDDRFMHAANRILSHVIDTFFKIPQNLEDIAYQLGYNTLDKADNFNDPIETLRKFYNVVGLTADSTDRRWAGGWKVIRRHDETELSEIWELLCDGDGPRWFASRKIAERDWKEVLGKSVRCEIKKQGDSVGVRFLADEVEIRTDPDRRASDAVEQVPGVPGS